MVSWGVKENRACGGSKGLIEKGDGLKEISVKGKSDLFPTFR